jgi:hypothetical protein
MSDTGLPLDLPIWKQKDLEQLNANNTSQFTSKQQLTYFLYTINWSRQQNTIISIQNAAKKMIIDRATAVQRS